MTLPDRLATGTSSTCMSRSRERRFGDGGVVGFVGRISCSANWTTAASLRITWAVLGRTERSFRWHRPPTKILGAVMDDGRPSHVSHPNPFSTRDELCRSPLTWCPRRRRPSSTAMLRLRNSLLPLLRAASPLHPPSTLARAASCPPPPCLFPSRAISSLPAASPQQKPMMFRTRRSVTYLEHPAKRRSHTLASSPAPTPMLSSPCSPASASAAPTSLPLSPRTCSSSALQ